MLCLVHMHVHVLSRPKGKVPEQHPRVEHKDRTSIQHRRLDLEFGSLFLISGLALGPCKHACKGVNNSTACQVLLFGICVLLLCYLQDRSVLTAGARS